MAYVINKFNGEPLVTLQDASIDTTTSVSLVGRSYVGYGEVQNENFVHLMENFANNAPPSRPIDGQTWFNTENNLLNVFNGVNWVVVGAAISSNTPPEDISNGSLWFDSKSKSLHIWDGTRWSFIGPESVDGFGITRARSGIILDSNEILNPVIFLTIDESVIAIVSSKSFMVSTSSTLPGFSNIKAGITISSQSQFSGNLSGVSDQAIRLKNVRLINGVEFDGTQDISIKAQTSKELIFGNFLQGEKFDGSKKVSISVDATSENLSNKVVARNSQGGFAAGTITADLAGNVISKGTSKFNVIEANVIKGEVESNAASASRLRNRRRINGVEFDGTQDISVPAAASTLTGNYINSAVITSNLEQVGTLQKLQVLDAGIKIGSLGQLSTSISSNGPIIETSNETLIIKVNNGPSLMLLSSLESTKRNGPNQPSIISTNNVNLGLPDNRFNNVYANNFVGHADSATTAELTRNMRGGGKGFILYQESPNVTRALPIGLAGQNLTVTFENTLQWTKDIQGYLTGSLTGDVFSIDKTKIINSIDKSVNAPGGLIGDVIGNAESASKLKNSIKFKFNGIDDIIFNGLNDITFPTVNLSGDQIVSGNKIFTSRVDIENDLSVKRDIILFNFVDLGPNRRSITIKLPNKLLSNSLTYTIPDMEENSTFALVRSSQSPGKFDIGNSSPTSNIRLNYDGNFHASQLYEQDNRVITTANQNKNTILAGPVSGTSDKPIFRKLVPDDIPDLDISKITTGALSDIFISDVSADKITTGRLVFDRLPTSNTANRFLKVSTANTSPSYSEISVSDIPILNQNTSGSARLLVNGLRSVAVNANSDKFSWQFTSNSSNESAIDLLGSNRSWRGTYYGDGTSQGFLDQSGNWVVKFNNGVLEIGTVSWSQVTNAPAVVTLTGNQDIKGTKTFTSVNGTRFEQRFNEDSIIIQGRSGGSAGQSITLTPGEVITTPREIKLPDISGTVVLDAGTQTIGGSKTFTNIITGNLAGSARTLSSITGNRTITVDGSQNWSTWQFTSPSSDASGIRLVASNGVWRGTYYGDGTSQGFLDQSGNWVVKFNNGVLEIGTVSWNQISDAPNFSLDNSAVKLSGNQNIAGEKTFTGRTKILAPSSTTESVLTVSATSNAGSGSTLLSGSINSNSSNRYFIDFRGLAGSSNWRVSSDGVLRNGIIPWSRLSQVPSVLNGTVNTSQNQSINGVKTFNDNTIFNGQVIKLPVGTTNQRPVSPSTGMMRWNTNNNGVEVFDGIRWVPLGSTERSLYSFSTVTFTSGGSTGRTGPSLAQARSGLSGTDIDTWRNNTEFFNASGGIQHWTVPRDGTYRIEAWGAQGGGAGGGRGARIRGDFSLTGGEILNILIGQQALVNVISCNKGGGGGTFVWRQTSPSLPLIAAGGGGGEYSNTTQGSGGTASQNGTENGAGSNGNGGTPGGAGWYSNGGTGLDGSNSGNQRPLEGGLGGRAVSGRRVGDGGFGGGASGSGQPCVNGGAGGGGGYSGGGGPGTIATQRRAGGGGGSYNSGTNQSNTGSARTGHGQVTITLL